MFILHASVVQGNLILWAEDSGSRNGPPDRQAAGEHPHCARPRLLAEAAGLETGDNCFDSAVAWLPSRGDAPVPSSALAGPMPGSRAKPRVRPWTVATLRPNPEQTVRLLQACQGQRVLKPGVIIGPDLAYWAETLKFALSLTVRQQFLPALSQRDGQTIAIWTPVFTGEDARRLAQLAGLMPASQGPHRYGRHGTAGHSSPSSPQGVLSSPGRPPGPRRHGIPYPGPTGDRLDPRRLAVRVD